MTDPTRARATPIPAVSAGGAAAPAADPASQAPQATTTNTVLPEPATAAATRLHERQSARPAAPASTGVTTAAGGTASGDGGWRKISVHEFFERDAKYVAAKPGFLKKRKWRKTGLTDSEIVVLERSKITPEQANILTRRGLTGQVMALMSEMGLSFKELDSVAKARPAGVDLAMAIRLGDIKALTGNHFLNALARIDRIVHAEALGFTLREAVDERGMREVVARLCCAGITAPQLTYFRSLGLSVAVLESLERLGFHPTEIVERLKRSEFPGLYRTALLAESVVHKKKWRYRPLTLPRVPQCAPYLAPVSDAEIALLPRSWANEFECAGTAEWIIDWRSRESKRAVPHAPVASTPAISQAELNVRVIANNLWMHFEQGATRQKKFDALLQAHGMRAPHLPHGVEVLTGLHARLGNGAFNSVAEVTTHVYTEAFEPFPLPRALKQFDPPGSAARSQGVIQKLGVPHDHPKLAQRNLATQQLNALLQKKGKTLPNVIVDTGLAMIPRPEGEPHLGLTMELVRGRTLDHASTKILRDPAVRQQLTLLQLIDGIAGQADRHGSNIMVTETVAGGYLIKGIDNDQCWGNNTSADDLLDRSRGFRGVGWPRMVDAVQAKAVLALRPEVLQAMLQAYGLDDAVQPALARLAEVQKLLNEDKIKIIARADWSKPAIELDLTTRRRSYQGYRLYRKNQGGKSEALPVASAFFPVKDGKRAVDNKMRAEGQAPDAWTNEAGGDAVGVAGDAALVTGAAGLDAGAAGDDVDGVAGAGGEGIGTPAFDLPGEKNRTRK